MALPSLALVRQPPRRRNYGAVARRAGGAIKRRGRSAAAAAWRNKAPIGVFGGATLLGYLDSSGHLDKVPVIGDFEPVVVAGVAGYFLTRNSSNPTTRAAGLGGLAVAGFALGHKWGKK